MRHFLTIMNEMGVIPQKQSGNEFVTDFHWPSEKCKDNFLRKDVSNFLRSYLYTPVFEKKKVYVNITSY